MTKHESAGLTRNEPGHAKEDAMPSTDAIQRYAERVNHWVDTIAQNPDDDQQTTELADVIVKEAALLAEDGPAAYLRYVAKLDDAAVRANLDRELDATTTDEEAGTEIPILLGGNDLDRCYRCKRTFTATTWRVVTFIHDHPEYDLAHVSVCRRCADVDVALSHWQGFCDIADMIDALMQAAPDKKARDQLKAMIEHCASHFSVWRWPDES